MHKESWKEYSDQVFASAHCQLSCQSHKSNRLIASLPLLLLSKLLLPPFYSYLLINRALFTNFLIARILALVPDGSFFFLLSDQQGALLIRDSEPCSNDNPNMEST